MKNKVEREEFLRNYKEWSCDNCAAQFGLRFYTHEFRNDAKVIVTECDTVDYKGEPSVDVRYNLILSAADGYNPYDKGSGHSANEFFTYSLRGVGIGTIVDYMTRRKDEI